MTLRVEATGGVGDDGGVAARSRRADRVEDDRRRIAVRFARNDRDSHALGPTLELFDGRGAERVGGGEQRTLSGILESLGELRRGGRLAAAVDPDDEDDPRPLTVAA